MFLRSTILMLLSLQSALSNDQPIKAIHNAFALHPVALNDFYANPESVTPTKATIEDTVKEVQDLIKADPSLPKLTRGEIIDIIENITTADSNGVNTREEGKRALMVVMPFTAGSAQGDDIKELYTRTPVTHIIGGQVAQMKKSQKKNRRRPTIPPSSPLPEEEIGNLYKTAEVPSTTLSPITLTRVTKYLVNAPTTISAKTTKIEKTTSTPTTTITTTSPPSIQFRPKVPQKPKPQRKYPNHRYPDDIPTNSQGGIHVVKPPQLSPMHYDSHFSAPFTISLNKLQTPATEFTTTLSTTTQRNIIDDIPIPENYKHVVKGLNLLVDTNDNGHVNVPIVQKLTTVKDVVTSQRNFATSTSIPNIANVAENLSPDMKDLLRNFGLLEDPNKKNIKFKASTESIPYPSQQNAEIKPESYVSFKPLPDSAPSRSDMEEFLARFGLGTSAFRSQKSVSMDKPNKDFGKVSEINMDVVPPSMRHVMKNIGFKTDIQKIQSLNQISYQPQHVFNPSVQTANEEELEKLGKLIDMIKDLGTMNGSITEENLKNIDVKSLKELIGDFNGHKFVPLNEQEAPNPLSYDDTQQRNGVKRQENSTTTSTTTSEPTTESATDGPNLMDLEASFGNQADTTTRSTTTTTEPTTTTPRTGFFYLLDWNSFLELDNQEGRRLNLRFQPHSGDPSVFVPINVP